MSKKGALIVIEGTDGSGKATQTKLLIERLNSGGISSKNMSFPRYHTPTGRIISQCYLGKKRAPEEGDVAWFGDADSVDPMLASLYYAADRYAAVPDMMKILNSGTHLILDRYYQSNMAHQGGKILESSRRLSFFEFERILELELLKIPKQDLAIFLHMPAEVTLVLRKDRGEEIDGHEKNIEHILRAERVYLEMTRSYGYDWQIVSCAPDGTINSLKTPESISEEIYSIVEDFLLRQKLL